MHNIEVDDQVYDFLAKKAEAFVDTPNSVLRRLLKIDDNGESIQRCEAPRRESQKAKEKEVSSEAFIRKFWAKKFQGVPRQVGRYRMMLESDTDIVYFQNFNKLGSPNLWFRLNPSPLETIRSSRKRSWICFTNPAERFGYLIPISAVDSKAQDHKWSRPEYEVNIDVADDRWREFDWKLGEFLVSV